MKAAELRDLGVDELRRAGARARRSAVPACGSRSRWGSSRRRTRCATVRRDLARVKTVLRQKRAGSSAWLTKSEKVGVVVSNKMQKSVVVAVEWQVRHGLYGKTERRTSKFMVHDEKNEAKVGDTVAIVETRPLSRRKRWALTRIVRARRRTGQPTAENSHDSDAIDPRRRRQLRRAQDRRHQPDRRIDRPLRAARRHRHRVGEGSDAGRRP